MKLWEVKKLLQDIKQSIKYANDHADYARVRHLKAKRRQLKFKVFDFTFKYKDL